MNIARSMCPLRRSIPQNIYRNYKISTTNYESSPTTQLQVKEEKFSFEDVKVIERVERRKPKIPPFMKECFMSNYNRDLLAYPEILNKEETKELEDRVAKLDSIFKDVPQNERENAMLDIGLHLAPLNLTMGGLAMNITERIRYLETVSSDVVLGKKLSDHWVGLSIIMKGLSENKFNEILPDLNKGDLIGLCVKETIPTRVTQSNFRTTAKLDNHDKIITFKCKTREVTLSRFSNNLKVARYNERSVHCQSSWYLPAPQADIVEATAARTGFSVVAFVSVHGPHSSFTSGGVLSHARGVWRLNGEKACQIANGFYVVMALSEGQQIAAFLVTPNSQGVEYVSPYIAFRDTPAIPLDNIAGEALFSALGISRLDTAVLSYSLLKNVLLKTVEYVRGKFVNGVPLAEVSTIKARIGQGLLSVYAAESMAYFTAGILDGYYEPDADVEMAMCRSFTAETCYDSLHQVLVIPGLEAGDDSMWTTYLNQYRSLSVHDEMIDNINLFTAMNALQHVGKSMVTEVKQYRNPLFYPMYILKKVYADRHQDVDNPKLTLNLCEHLHPSFKNASDHLEYCVLRLRFACEALLHRYGKDVITAYTELDRLAQAGTQVLAMSAALARASRSYCIGLRNAEIEMKLAACFVDSSKQHTKTLINDIVDGEYINLDRFKIDFGKKVLDTNSVLVEKATERVFW